MVKLSLYASLLIFILASCDQTYNTTAKSKYTCGKATLIVEKIGENNIEEHLTMHPKHKSVTPEWCGSCKALKKYLVRIV